MTDTSFDTNPEQHHETSGNEPDVDSACLSEFCNLQQPLELRWQRLLISRFQVRVLGGSLEEQSILQVKLGNTKSPAPRSPVTRFSEIGIVGSGELGRRLVQRYPSFGIGLYSQPFRSARWAASARFRVPSFLIAVER